MYRNIVTVLTFLTVWALMFLVWQIHITSDTGNRYQIMNTDNSVILIDKRTGITWRNIWNNDKDKIPANWEIMNYEDNLYELPIGMQNLKTHLWENLEEDKN